MSLARAKAFLAAGLSNASLWGAAASAEGQRAAGYARRYGDHLDAFETHFTSEVDGARRVDPAASRAFLTDPEGHAGGKALEATVASARATADTARKFGKKDEADRIHGAIATMERTERKAAAVRAARGSVSRETGDPASAALQWLSGGVPPGLSSASQQRSLQDAALGNSNATAEAAAQRMAARGATFRAAQSMSRVARDGNRRGVDAMLSPPGENAATRIAPIRPSALTVETFDAHRDHVDRMSRDPSYFGDVMAASFGSMSEAAPEVFQAISAQAAKTVQYLSAVAPGGASGGPFAQRFPVGEDELWEYNERVRAIADPEYIRDEISTGRLSAPAIETFEVMYPKQYAQMQRDVFERLQQLNEQGITLPIQAREQLDTALNIDGGGDPALTWKVAERAYAATQRKNASSSGRVDASGKDSHAGAMTSGALATLNNGASAIAQTG